ncbi:hypothetical protein ACPXCG_21470 [Gordonia sp. DT218]
MALTGGLACILAARDPDNTIDPIPAIAGTAVVALALIADTSLIVNLG